MERSENWSRMSRESRIVSSFAYQAEEQINSLCLGQPEYRPEKSQLSQMGETE